MIEKISLTNFLSFKEKTDFDFTASQERTKTGYEHIKWIHESNKKKLLKAIFLFGNNGTGKTNLLCAFEALQNLICEKRNSKESKENKIPDHCFKLSQSTLQQPSVISIIFHAEGIRYLYDISFGSNTIWKESLQKQEKSKFVTIFDRRFDYEKDIVLVDFPSNCVPESSIVSINENVIRNTSVISIYDNKNIESTDIKNVFTYFNKLRCFYNLQSISLPSMFNRRDDKARLKKILLSLLNDLGSNIIDYNLKTTEIKLTEREIEIFKSYMPLEIFEKMYPNGLRKDFYLEFAHKADNEEKKAWLSEVEESVGTLNMIRLIIILYDAIIDQSPVIIDECAAGIHQHTFGRIMQYFLSTSSNCQVLMASQHLSIMEMDGFRRDTLRFFDKDRNTGISMCQKIDLHKYHKNLNIARTYLDNSFGCLPEFPTIEEWIKKLEIYSEIMKEDITSDNPILD